MVNLLENNSNFQLVQDINQPFTSLEEKILEETPSEEILADTWKEKIAAIALKISRLAFGVFRMITLPIENLIFRKKQNGIGEYCFTQQFNDSCHISPLMNLKILEKIKRVGYDLSKVDFYSKREWIGENQEMLIAWHDLMAKLCEANASEKYPELYKYMMGGFDQGPILPHFYQEDGSRSFRGLKGLLDFGMLPYFFIDMDDIKKTTFNIMGCNIDFGEMISHEYLGLNTSIVNDSGIYKIYNSETKAFVPIDDLDWISIEKEEGDSIEKSMVKVNRESMTEGDRGRYPLPPEGYDIVMHKSDGLGFSEIGVVNRLGGGFKIKDSNDEVHSYIPFQMSLLKLLFLTSGIDEENNPISREHSLYGAYQELRDLMSGKQENLWNSQNLEPNKLLQYHLAEMFKEDKDLFRKAKGVVDVLIGKWKNHSRLLNGEFYDQNNKQMNRERVKDYILGDEQAVAYYFMHNIRMAWYSSINPKVMIHWFDKGLPKMLGPLAHQYLLGQLKAPHRIRLEDGSVVTRSFLQVWDEMLNTLKQRDTRGRTDFMSFDDHGWVVSFDETLIEMQNNCHVYDKTLLKRLGIAGIESWGGSDLGLWYKKNREQAAVDLQQSTELLDTTVLV